MARPVLPSTPLDRAPAPAFFVLGAISQYLGAALAVVLFDRMAVAGVAWLRVLAAAVVLYAWRRPRLRAPRDVVLGTAVVFGVITALMNLSFYLAVEAMPLGNTVAMEFIGPITVAAFGSRTSRNLLALALAVAGVMLLADVEIDANPRGVAFAFLAGALWAGYIVYGKRVSAAGGHGRGLDGLAVATIAGAVVLTPLGGSSLPTVVTTPWLLGAAALVGVLSNVVPYALDQVVLPRLTQSHFALLLALLPATATLVGAVLLGQLPSLIEVVAIALVMAAVAVRAPR